MPGRKILLVEGKDDEHVLKHICGNRGVPTTTISSQPIGDAKRLLDAASPSASLRASNEEGDAVGVVIDADMDLDARWRSIHSRLLAVGYTNVPQLPDPNGTILSPPNGSLLPKTGIWIMPDNMTSGILEDFLRFLIPQPDPLFQHATTSVNAVPEQRFTDLDRPKALIHTWLAWQEEPGRPYGTAITARFLNPNLPQADILASWLKRLFL